MEWALLVVILGGALATVVQEVRVRRSRQELNGLRHSLSLEEKERQRLTKMLVQERSNFRDQLARSQVQVRNARDRLSVCREAVDALPESDVTRARLRNDLNSAFRLLEAVPKGDDAPTTPGQEVPHPPPADPKAGPGGGV